MSANSGSVLFLSHDASRTGAPIFLLRFLRWFGENQEIPYRVLIGGYGDLLGEFQSMGPVDLFEPEPTIFERVLRRLNVRPRDNADHLVTLRQKLSQSNIRAIYSNTIVNGKILDFLSFLNCPIICHVHELDSVIRYIGTDNLNLVKEHTSSYIAVSQAVKRNLVENHGISAELIRVIHGFIPTGEDGRSKTAQSHPDVRRELGIPNEARLVCACGSVETRKGIDLFVKVAEKVAETYKQAPVHFVWVGGRAKQVASMRKATHSKFQHKFVHFIGHRQDVSPYYDASDLFLLPSREDPFPLVMMEAALRKKAVVCFDNSGGAPEFVEQDAGFVVTGFDVNKMAEKTIELLASDELRDRMGAIARQKVLDRHDIRITAPEISAIIQGALVMPDPAPKRMRVPPPMCAGLADIKFGLPPT